MIELGQLLVWIGDHAVAVSAFGIAALVLGLIVYVAHDIPSPPIDDEDEHSKGIW